MSIEKLLSLIPGNLLKQLAIETGVDYYSKKLQGEVIFKLLLYCIITHKDNSLRTMESAYEKLAFQLLNQRYNQCSVKFNSISERLSTINVSFFEKIYNELVLAYKQHINDGEKIIRFDSTIIALSTRLLEIGYHIKDGDAEQYRQLKFTIGYSDIPEVVHFFHEERYTSENIALKESILAQSQKEATSIKVFDRGITARKAYDEFTENNIQFISRLNNNAKYTGLTGTTEQQSLQTKTLTIIDDQWCYLYSSNKQKTKYPLRRIEAIQHANGKSIIFITNIKHLDAITITEIYKRRWDIEVFFKFIKQLLNFKNLLNRSGNGIQVILYVTMIAAILLAAYKRINHLKGFKIAKQKFEQELETTILKSLITLCGGNPYLLKTLTTQQDP